MKAIGPTELIELLPASTEDISTLEARLTLAAPTSFRRQDRIREAIAVGWTTPETISINGVVAYVVCWNKTFDGGLWINVAQAITGKGDHSALFLGCEMIAHREHCDYVRFSTSRRGLVRRAQLKGYVPDAVLMTKELRHG